MDLLKELETARKDREIDPIRRCKTQVNQRHLDEENAKSSYRKLT